MSRFTVILKLLWDLLWLVLLFVPALLGTLHHAVPFVLVRRIAAWMDLPGRTTTSTHRLLVGLPVYLIWYAAVALVLMIYEPWIAWAWLVAAPFAGVLALHYWREARRVAILLYHQVRAIVGGRQLRQLREQQATLRQRLVELSEEYAAISTRAEAEAG